MNDHIQISDVTPRIQYAADGNQIEFSYPFPIFLEDDLEVYLDDTIKTSGYAVLGAGTSYGGTVTFDTPPTNGVVVTLRRSLAIERTTDFHQSGAFRAKVINDELDHLTAALQQVADDVSRAVRLRSAAADANLKLPSKDDRVNKVLGFDASGDVIAISDSGGAGGGVTNHGQLTGLSEDDHVQYHNNVRGDARYYTQAQLDTVLGEKSDTTHNHDAAYAPISHIDEPNNPHGVTKSHLGLDNVENIKTNLNANVDPTQNDDGTDGYAIGSRWINVAANREFVCLEATPEAATWIETTQSGSGGVSDHGGLTGLSDDDHPLYHNDARGDARYYTQAQVDTALGSKSDRTHNHDAAYAAISHVGDTNNPHGVTKSHVGLGDVENIKVNLSASIDPTQNDDGNLGYTAGSRWINTVASKEFVCLDAAIGAALWIETTQIGDGAISNQGGPTGLAEKSVSVSQYARLLSDEPTTKYRLVPDVYTKRTVVFDGASYLKRAGEPASVTDGKTGTFETYLKFEGGDAAKQVLMAGYFHFEVYKGTDNKIYADGRNDAVPSGLIMRLVSSAAYTVDSGWLHIVASWNLTDTGKRHLYVNGVADLAPVTYYTNDVIDYTRTIGIMCDGGGTPANIANCIVERIGLWQDYFDLSDPNLMAYFGIGENLADLGEDGILPDGTVPSLFFRGPAADFSTCRAGDFDFDFVTTGTLVDGPSNKGYWHTVGRKLYGPDGKQGRLVGFRHTPSGATSSLVTAADWNSYRDTSGVNFNMVAPEIWWSTNFGACELGPTQPGEYNTAGLLELKAAMIQMARAGLWIVPSLRVSFDPTEAADNLANWGSTGTEYHGWADHVKTLNNDPVVVDGTTYGNYRNRYFAWIRWLVPELLSEPEIAAAIAYWEMWHFPGHRNPDASTDAMVDLYTGTFLPAMIAVFREYEPDRLLGASFRRAEYTARAYDQSVTIDDHNLVYVIGGYGSHRLQMEVPGIDTASWPPVGMGDAPEWLGPGADDFTFVLWSAAQDIAFHSQEGPGLDPSKQTEPLNASVKTYLEGLGDLYNRYAHGLGWHFWEDRPTAVAGTELGDIIRSDAYFGGASLYAFTKVNSSAAKLGANPQIGTSYTLVENDKFASRVTFNSASAVTVNVEYSGIRWAVGDEVNFLNLGAGAVTIQGGSTSPVTISKASDQTAVISQGKAATLHFTGGTTAMIFGDMDAV